MNRPRWRLHIERNLWPLPRPYFSWGWELDQAWIGLDFGARGIDSIIGVTLAHTLSDRQLRAAMWLREKLT